VASAAQSAAQVAHAALAALDAQPGVTVHERATESGVVMNAKYVLGQTKGEQVISLDGSVAVTGLAIGTTMYIKASAIGLDTLGFSTAGAKKEAGAWIAVRPGAAGPKGAAFYKSAIQDMTIPSLGSDVGSNLSSPHFGAATAVGTTRVLTLVSGSGPNSYTLYVRSQGTPLPVEQKVTQKGATETATFGPWGPAPALSAPSKAVPLDPAWLAS
jgi:hypothetical protein